MPDWNEQIRRQLTDLNLAPAREAEIVEELAQHAEDRYRELQSGGATEAEKREDESCSGITVLVPTSFSRTCGAMDEKRQGLSAAPDDRGRIA